VRDFRRAVPTVAILRRRPSQRVVAMDKFCVYTGRRWKRAGNDRVKLGEKPRQNG
jgi:hypothetical protein